MPCPLTWREFRERLNSPTPALYTDHAAIERRFPAISERHDRVIVVGSGPSGAICGTWERHPGVPVIAVNAAIEGLKFTPDYFFTLDPKPAREPLWGVERPGCKRFIACFDDVGPNASDLRYRQDFTGAHLLIRRYGPPARDKRTVHHSNSGISAIQLALHMEATRIAVFGVDLGGAYWAPEYGPMAQWTGLHKLLESLAGWGADIRFARHRDSTVTGFEKLPPARLLTWIQTAIDGSDQAAIVGPNSQAAPARVTGDRSPGQCRQHPRMA